MTLVETLDAAQECPVCLGMHDEEIHDATVTIHQWLRSEIARRAGWEVPEPETLVSTATSTPELQATAWALSCGA